MLLVFLFFIIASISCAQGPLGPFIPLVSRETRAALQKGFSFDYFKPFDTLVQFIHDGKAPILFYSPSGKKKPTGHNEITFIPLKKFNNPNKLCTALRNLGSGLLNKYSASTQFKRYSHIYECATQLTEATFGLLGLLERHPNNARIIKPLNILFQSWNKSIQDHPIPFVRACAIKSKNLKENSSDLLSLKKAWFLAHNYVIFQTIIDSSKDKETNMQSTHDFEDNFKKTINELHRLKEESTKISAFDRLYGKRYVILCFISCLIIGSLFYFNHSK